MQPRYHDLCVVAAKYQYARGDVALASTTGKVIVPTRSIEIVTLSPGTSGPTPSGVPRPKAAPAPHAPARYLWALLLARIYELLQ